MRALLIVTLAAVCACGSLGGNATTTVPNRPVSTSQTTGPLEPTLGCPQNADLVDDGRLMRIDQPESDTASIGLISWQESEGCEVFQIDFETTEGAPATTPPSVIVEFLESRQIIRIHIAATATVVTDQVVETSLVDRLYVVHALDGGMFIDLHLSRPAKARARVSNSPARLVLDLQEGLTEFAGTTAISDGTVLVTPWEGAETATNLEVSGYSRLADRATLVIATSGNQVVAETDAEVAEAPQGWGEFKTRIDLPVGNASLFVGDREAESGNLAGVTVKIVSR